MEGQEGLSKQVYNNYSKIFKTLHDVIATKDL